MSDATITLIVLAVGTYLLKAAAPLVLAGRSLPPRVERVAEALPAGLLAALTVVSTVSVGTSIHMDARLIGLAVAFVALWRKAPFVVVVGLAVLATAGARLLG